MIRCPNHTRKKRPHSGGGKPGCRTPLHLKIETTLDFQANRWPKLLSDQGDFDLALGSKVRKSGKRLAPREIFESFSRGKWDLVCPGCGYSLRRSLVAINLASHRKFKK